MKREADAFLTLVRDAENPSRADEERVLRALTASIAAGATFGASAAGARSASSQTWLGKAAASLGSKLSLIAALTSVGLGGGDSAAESLDARRAPGTLVVPAQTATAPAQAVVLPAQTARSDTLPSERRNPSSATLELGPPSATTRARPRAEQRASTVRAELALLRDVQASLKRGDGGAALRALDAHRTRDRTFLAERDAARILALCQAGRTEEARRAASEFAHHHADSVQREAVANSCAKPQRNRRP